MKSSQIPMYESQTITKPNPDPNGSANTSQSNINLNAVQLAVGKIITIETCFGCKTHSFSTWHTEERYTRVFEEVKAEIEAQNPDVQIIRNTGPGSKRGAFEIYHGEFLLFSKITAEIWPGAHWMGQQLHSYFDDLANGRDISKYANMIPEYMGRSSPMGRSSLRKSQFGMYGEDSIVDSPVALNDQEKEEMERALREKRELERLNRERLEKERKDREREQEERDRLARERREKERLAKEQEKKDRANDDNKNDENAKKFKIQKGSRKLAKTLLKELSSRLEKSITTPLVLDGKTLVEFINTKGILTDPDTYAEPWELAIDDADNIKGSLIMTIYKYFDLMRFPEQVKQLDFDVHDSNGFTPLGVALGGGMALTNCFINETSVETNDSTVSLSGFFTLKNTVKYLLDLADKSQSKLSPQLRNDEHPYTTLHDVLLRHIFSPIPYNQNDQSLVNLDSSTDGDMDKLRDECNKIFQRLDLSKVDTSDLAVNAFKDKETFEQLKKLIGNPKEFYGAKGMHKDFIENMVAEYNTSKVETTFWGGSSILAFAGTKCLEGILGILKSKQLRYSPYKRNPMSGAYSFVWNAAAMEVSDIKCIIEIGDVSAETLKLGNTDDFGFSFLNYLQVAMHSEDNRKESMLDFLENKFKFDLKGYHSYNKASKQGAVKKKRESMFRWTQRVTNKAKWEIRYETSVQDSYMYKTVLQELSQEKRLKSLNYDISSELLAHIAREICCWKGTVYDEELLEERAHRIHEFLKYLDAREKQKQTQNPQSKPQTQQSQPAAQGQSQAQAVQPQIIELKRFYEGSKRCNCRIVNNKIQSMPDGQDNLSGLFISIIDKPRPVSDKPSEIKAASPAQPVSYAEIALLIYLSLEKGTWQAGYETFRSNSLWSGLCFDCFQRFKDSLPRDKTIKTEPEQAKAQVLSRLVFESITRPEMLKKYLEYTKSSKLKLDLKTEFDGLNIIEKVLLQSSAKQGNPAVAVEAQGLLISYIQQTSVKFNLNHRNRRTDTLLNKFRDEKEVLGALSTMVEKQPELFVFRLEAAKDLIYDPDFAEKLRFRCELLRLSNRAEKALDILDKEQDRLKSHGIEEDLETLYLRAKLYETMGKGFAEKAKEVYRRIAAKYDGEKNRVVLSSVLGNENMKLSKNVADVATPKNIPKVTGDDKDSLGEALYQLSNLDNNTNDFTQVKVDFNKMDLLLKLGKEKEALHLLSDKFPKLLGIDLESTLGTEKAELIKKTIGVFQRAQVLSPEELKDPKAKNLKADQVRSFVSQMTACINQGMNSDDVKKLSEKLGVTEKQIEEMNQILKLSGMIDEAAINKEFSELKEKNKNQFHYAINFYWTLQNYLEVERMMSTNMFMVNRDEFEKQTHQKTFAKIIAKKVAEKAGDVLSEVPVFGGLAKMVIKAVDWYFEKVDEKAEHDYTNAINLVLRYYPGAVMKTPEVTRYAARAALEIAKNKKSLKPTEDNSIVGKIKQVAEDLQAAIIGKEVDLYTQPEALAAYQDVIIVIIYMAKNYQDLVDEKKQGKETFAQMIEKVITEERYKKTLKEPKVEGAAPEQRSACCEMF